MKETIYGPGGFDPSKPHDNVLEEVELPDVAIPVPDAASPATIRVSLRRLHGITNAALDATVQAVLAGIADPGERDDAETLWLYSVSIRRDHPLVAAVGQALNLSSAQVDDVFRTASTV